MSLESRPLFNLTLTLHPTIELGRTPAGARRVFAVSGGTFAADRLKGTVSPLIAGPLNVRTQEPEDDTFPSIDV